MEKSRKSAALLAAAGLAAGLLLGGLARTPAPVAVAAAPAAKRAEGDLEELRGFANKLSRVFRAASDAVSPAVVYISTEWTETVRRPNPWFNDPFFGPGARRPRGPREFQRPRRSLGSGVIVDEEGYILTNYHVVQRAEKLEVKLADGGTFKAEVVGTDPKTELAVIRIKGAPENLPTVKLGDSDVLAVGDWVLAIGNPFGFAQTVSAGIVSGKGRVLGMAQYENMIQTDAAINPGNSGGPLVNLRGEVVGINTAIYSPTGGNQGLGFAIPAKMALEVLPSLMKGEKIERGHLGILGSELTAEIRKQFGYEGEGGALIDDVFADSPAEKGELQPGDIITEWDGQEVESFREFRRIVAATKPGRTVKLKVWRGGAEKALTVKVASQAEAEAMAQSEEKAKAEVGWLGLKVGPVTDEVRERMNRGRLSGVVVTEVEPGSPAAKIGIQRGDVIRSVDQVRVRSATDFRNLVARKKRQKTVLLHVVDHRTGRAGFVIVGAK